MSRGTESPNNVELDNAPIRKATFIEGISLELETRVQYLTEKNCRLEYLIERFEGSGSDSCEDAIENHTYCPKLDLIRNMDEFQNQLDRYEANLQRLSEII